MAEVLAVLGGVGSIFSIVDGISKVIGIIRDLQARWGEADLTLLSLASQLTALRAASSKIQEWIDQDLQDTHHQLVMDLDVSISCCNLLMNKVENFFADLSQSTEKPLDLCEKWKVVFGSSGAEGVQRLIEHQTSALTLLLTACNCRTISAQQKYLESKKTRKVLQRAKADSVSLYVHRDTASLTSKITDNLSKISRTFEFDSNIFATGVYERAFRGSIKDILRRRQYSMNNPLSPPDRTEIPSPPKRRKRIRIRGQDQIGMDLLINTIETDRIWQSNDWLLHQLKLQKICWDLLCKIVHTHPGLCDHAYMTTLVLLKAEALLSEVLEPRPDVLETCAEVWRHATRLDKEYPITRSSHKYRIELEGMIFWVRSISDRGLSITGGNYAARLFIHLMDRALPVNPSELLPSGPRLADRLRAEKTCYCFGFYAFNIVPGNLLKENVLQDVTYQFTVGSPDTVTTVSTDTRSFGDETAVVFFFDLHDYNIKSYPFEELEGRAATSSSQIANLRPDHDHPMIGLVFRNFSRFVQQVEKLGFPLRDETTTNDPLEAIARVQELLETRRWKPSWRFSFVLNTSEDTQGADLMVLLHNAISESNTASGTTLQDSGKDE